MPATPSSWLHTVWPPSVTGGSLALEWYQLVMAVAPGAEGSKVKGGAHLPPSSSCWFAVATAGKVESSVSLLVGFSSSCQGQRRTKEDV